LATGAAGVVLAVDAHRNPVARASTSETTRVHADRSMPLGVAHDPDVAPADIAASSTRTP